MNKPAVSTPERGLRRACCRVATSTPFLSPPQTNLLSTLEPAAAGERRWVRPCMALDPKDDSISERLAYGIMRYLE